MESFWRCAPRFHLPSLSNHHDMGCDAVDPGKIPRPKAKVDLSFVFFRVPRRIVLRIVANTSKMIDAPLIVASFVRGCTFEKRERERSLSSIVSHFS